MSRTSFISQFAVYSTCTNLDAQVKLYTELGFIIDDGYDAVEDVQEDYFTSRGISKANIVKTTALKLPADPYMHLILTEFKAPNFGPKWPATWDQVGSRAHAFLVHSLDTEVKRIRRDFPKVNFLHGPISVHRKWGRTTTALMIDPDGLFFELIEIDPSGPYFTRDLKTPPPTEKCWLHYMANTESLSEQLAFYESFEMSHDSRVDFRKDVGFHPNGYEKFAKDHEDALGLKMEDHSKTAFLRNLSDISNNHVELVEYKNGTLLDPGIRPVWNQKGISRFCFRTPNKELDLYHSKMNRHKIYIEDNKICIGWGDTEYYDMGDVDGNIVTCEEWHPYGYFGEKT